MRNTQKENVAEHSFITAMVAHALCVISNELYGGKLNADRAATLALYHEAAEVLTGDLPTPVKYHNDGIRSAYKSMEREAEKKIVGVLPENLKSVYEPLVSPVADDPEYKYVKFADKIAALIKCNEELSVGNVEFKTAADSILKSLSAVSDKAVKYFLDNFISSFGLSLDESL